MKKLMSLSLALLMALALAACGGGNAPAEPTPEPTPEAAPEAAAPEEEPAPEEDADTGAAPDAEPEADPALAALVDAGYAACPVQLMMPETHAIELSNTDGMAAFDTGLAEEDLAGLDAAVISQSMTGSQAYSLVAARVKDAAEAPEMAAALLENAPAGKWICVAPNAVRVAACRDVVFCVMTDTELADPDALMDALVAAAGGSDMRDGRDLEGAEALGGFAIPVPDGEPVA